MITGFITVTSLSGEVNEFWFSGPRDIAEKEGRALLGSGAKKVEFISFPEKQKVFCLGRCERRIMTEAEKASKQAARRARQLARSQAGPVKGPSPAAPKFGGGKRAKA